MAIEIPFVASAFFILGIERILYGFWSIYPETFKAEVRKGTFGQSIKKEPLYWKSAMTLGKYVKVFQFSAVLYDIFVRCDLVNTIQVDVPHLVLGLGLIAAGQALNIAVFKALGCIGVYYGNEFGYPVKMVSCFPYNVSWISDPQYWGVVMTVWGIYIALGVTSYVIPVYETIWYVASMKFLEHERGRILVRGILGADIKYAKK